MDPQFSLLIKTIVITFLIKSGGLQLQKNLTESRNNFLEELSDYEKYKLLCQGAIFLPPNVEKYLKCRYIDNNSAFLKIAPFKVEEVFLEPRILIFHNIIYDHEIDIIQQLAKPKFEKAMFLNSETREKEFLDFRITNIAWLDNNIDKNINILNRRVEQMTNLSMETAESFQVAFYEIGGKYEPHYDFARKNDVELKESVAFHETGNRIATVLFYMNNVEKGGATVFPKINVSITPIKGSAAFWFNLKPNGVEDFLTLHAACPVISGTKWAANKWIHELGQEFRRPCTLENQSNDP